jgi:hypothetical protein
MSIIYRLFGLPRNEFDVARDLKKSGISDTSIVIDGSNTPRRGYDAYINLGWKEYRIARQFVREIKVDGNIDEVGRTRAAHHVVEQEALRYQRFLGGKGIDVTIDDRVEFPNEHED